jgi:ribonuclease D
MLHSTVDALMREPLIAVDTESNSLYAYQEQVCLIQISTRTHDYIIDPLAIPDMKPLGVVFADPAIEKVFHAVTYDVMTMKRDFGYTFANLFDTMIAARMCGVKSIGLNNLVNLVVGIELDKSHQRDNWGARPLSRESLRYAQCDTHFLPTIRDYFAERFTELEYWHEARETFADLVHLPAAQHQFDPEGYWRIGKPHRLKPHQMAVLREMYLWREQQAKRANIPPFKVVQDKSLIAVAALMPTTLDELSQAEGMSAALVRRYGNALLQAIERGKRASPPAPPAPETPPDPFVVDVYSALREWRKQRAEQRGVEADVILAREALWTLAEQMPTSVEAMSAVPGLGDWRRERYGQELLAVLDRFRPTA